MGNNTDKTNPETKTPITTNKPKQEDGGTCGSGGCGHC
jgi:hypothetical protein